MDIVVNGRFLSRRVTGVERYGREILRRLPGKPRLAQPAHQIQGAKGHAWEQFVLPSQVRPGEILWSPANTGPLAITRQVLTLHDLSALEHPEWFAPAFRMWYRIYVPRLVRRVRQVVVPSEYVRQKARQRFCLPPEKISVVPGGVDLNRFYPDFHQPSRLPARYVLWVGSLQPRKNLVVLLQAWERVRPYFPGVWLLLAGGENPNFRPIYPSAAAGHVHFLGYVPDADLPRLYTEALVLVYPSLDEGFGLPVLEAMASGTPVIASGAGALPEIVGQAGLLFDPQRPAELADILARLLDDVFLRRRLSEKGLVHAQAYSWQHSAEKLWEVLQTCESV